MIPLRESVSRTLAKKSDPERLTMQLYDNDNDCSFFSPLPYDFHSHKPLSGVVPLCSTFPHCGTSCKLIVSIQDLLIAGI